MPKVFTTKIKKGKAIGAQAGLSDDLTKVFSILENLEGIGGVEIKRDGVFWRIAITSSMAGSSGSSGGIPTGWSERADAIVDIQWDSTYHKLQVKRGTVLVKDSTEDASWSDLLTFAEYDA